MDAQEIKVEGSRGFELKQLVAVGEEGPPPGCQKLTSSMPGMCETKSNH